LDAAHRAQGLTAMMSRLRDIVPDVRDQYTDGPDGAEFERYWERKMRGLHAFQIRCALDALDAIGGGGHVIVDIGDSSGTHAAYLSALAKPGQIDKVISVNLDPVAVAKIQNKGGHAILCRAEELALEENIVPSLFMSFETLEHLTDPVRFLHGLADRGGAEHLLFTVPYTRHSRFGGHLMRQSAEHLPAALTPEATHIFELSPDDWALLARFAGFSPVFTRIYAQVPRFPHPLAATRPLWKKLDFEGFVAVFAQRDPSLSARYTGW